jgi:hypothetical protein
MPPIMGSFVRFYTFGGLVGMPSNLRPVARSIGLRDATSFISIFTLRGRGDRKQYRSEFERVRR